MVSQAPAKYQRLVDGLVLPLDVGAHPVLDFCNTRAGWGEPDPREYLISYEHLVALTREAGLVDPHVANRVISDEGVVARAIALREAVYEAITERSDEALEYVAIEARRAIAAAKLVRGIGWVVPSGAGAELPVLALALAAAEFLGSSDVANVGRCPGHGCGWLFLDRRGRRRWCLMEVCGNRAKARRHAAKVRG